MLRWKGEPKSGVRRGRAPSREMRDLALVRAELELDSLLSEPNLVRPGARCCNVDFLSPKGRRCGDCADGLGQVENPEVLSLSVSFSPPKEGIGSMEGPSGPCSKTLKSAPKESPPCRLRRFTRGLPMLAASRFITPSLLLSGLDFGGLSSLNTG